jgi:4-methyl-5(b-hydroxyethyl)-thiazole monophosphate biosynthesis
MLRLLSNFERESKPIVGESGLQFQPHACLDDIDPQDYEALIIPGGDMIYLKYSESLFSFVRELYRQGKLLAAICSGPYVLARSGLLEKREYTVTLTKEQREFLGCFNESAFRSEPVVENDLVITAQGHAYIDFGLCVGKRLGAIKCSAVESFYKGKSNQMMESTNTQNKG